MPAKRTVAKRWRARPLVLRTVSTPEGGMMVETIPRLIGPAPAVTVLNHVVVRLRLIGQMEAWTIRSESVLPTGRKTRALLACIAMAAPRAVLRGRLAEQLWSRRPEEQARSSLRQEVHRLLEALAPAETDVLIVTRDHLTLRPGAVWIEQCLGEQHISSLLFTI